MLTCDHRTSPDEHTNTSLDQSHRSWNWLVYVNLFSDVLTSTRPFSLDVTSLGGSTSVPRKDFLPLYPVTWTSRGRRCLQCRACFYVYSCRCSASVVNCHSRRLLEKEALPRLTKSTPNSAAGTSTSIGSSSPTASVRLLFPRNDYVRSHQSQMILGWTLPCRAAPSTFRLHL